MSLGLGQDLFKINKNVLLYQIERILTKVRSIVTQDATHQGSEIRTF